MPLITVTTPMTRLEEGHISINYTPRDLPWEVSEERAADAVQNGWGAPYETKVVKPDLEVKVDGPEDNGKPKAKR